jgi:hypothetical protein
MVVLLWLVIVIAVVAVAAFVIACCAAWGGLGSSQARRGHRGFKGETGTPGPTGESGSNGDPGATGAPGAKGATGTFNGLLNVISVDTGNSPFLLTASQTNSVVFIDGSGGAGGATVLLPGGVTPIGTFYYFSVIRSAGANDINFDAGAGNTIDFSGFAVPGAAAQTNVGEQVFLETIATVDQTFSLVLMQVSPANYWRVFTSGPASLS